jgi:hypothetical protein
MIESKTSNIIDTISTTGGTGITQDDINDIAAATEALILQNHGSGSYSTSSLQTSILDDISLIKQYSNNSLKILKGKWEINTSNRLVMYDEDGSSILYQFSLHDINSNPSTGSIMKRIPI